MELQTLTSGDPVTCFLVTAAILRERHLPPLCGASALSPRVLTRPPQMMGEEVAAREVTSPRSLGSKEQNAILNPSLADPSIHTGSAEPLARFGTNVLFQPRRPLPPPPAALLSSCFQNMPHHVLLSLSLLSSAWDIAPSTPLVCLWKVHTPPRPKSWCLLCEAHPGLPKTPHHAARPTSLYTIDSPFLIEHGLVA